MVPVLDRACACSWSSAGRPPAAVEAGISPGAAAIAASCNSVAVAAGVAPAPATGGEASIHRRWRWCPCSTGPADAAVEQAVAAARPRSATLAHRRAQC
jgi:hypothetical protein